MKLNWTIIRKHLRTFIFWYCVFFFSSLVFNTTDSFHSLSLYMAPMFGGLMFTVFFSPDAIWPVYKKGDKVWWSTYGEEDPKSSSAIIQKRIFRFVSAYCFMFTLEILNKKAPIYLSLKDYITPAVFALALVLFLSREAIWPINKEKPTESSS